MLLEQNPLPYLARFPGADVLTSSDQVVPTVVDDRLDIWQQGEYYVKKPFNAISIYYVYLMVLDSLHDLCLGYLKVVCVCKLL